MSSSELLLQHIELLKVLQKGIEDQREIIRALRLNLRERGRSHF